MASLAAARGARVFAGVLDPSLVGTEENSSGGEIHRIALDVSDGPSVAGAAELVRSYGQSLHILVNNAGILGDIDSTLFDPLDFDQMLRVYNVNALGSLRVTQAFLGLLLAGPRRLVVNVSSEAGSLGACARSSWYAYAMAKAALNMQSCLVHNLIKDQGGRVLVVHPGHVRTFMRGEEDTTGALSPGEAAQRLWANIERPPGSEGVEFRGPEGERLPW